MIVSIWFLKYFFTKEERIGAEPLVLPAWYTMIHVTFKEGTERVHFSVLFDQTMLAESGK